MSLALPDPCAEVLILPGAADQITEIARRYEKAENSRTERPAAVRRLRKAVADAERALLAGRRVRKSFPSVYSSMARQGEEWLHVHRYWFGYVRIGNSAVVFTVLDEQADMDRRP